MTFGPRLKTDDHNEGHWPGRLAQMCKVDNIEKIEPASNFEDVADKLQSVNQKKVSWIMLDCHHELHKSMTYDKFAT